MKVAAITGKEECALVDVPDPMIRDNYVLVEIKAAPMCTEVSAYRSGHVSDVLGHEAAGIVVAVAQPGRVKVGDRVVVMPQNGCGHCDLCISGEHIRCQSPRDPLKECGSETGRATFAQYCIQQDWLLYPLPEDISLDHASMACCGLGPTFNAVRRMNVSSTDTVLITGLGAVGLGGIVNARLRGARVIGVESNPWRSDLARQLGAEAVIDPNDTGALDQIKALTHGLGADKSIEASSAESAPGFLVQATKINGEITTVGWGGPVLARDLNARGITLHAAWHWNHLAHAEAMRQTLRAARDQIELLITHRLPMSQLKEAWELQLKGECGKIVLDPWA